MSRHIDAAQARAAGMRAHADRPQQRRCSPEEGFGLGTVRTPINLDRLQIRSTTRNGLKVVQVGGYASTTGQAYEMFDFWGPYTELVSPGSFGETLDASPLVEFTLNHGAGGGIPMAHTRNDTLELGESEEPDEDGVTGLRYDAFVDPTRSDVSDMLKALERGDLAEASFKFRITKGSWSPDWTEYHIEGVDLNRGDVSAVNFGANPNATSGLRSAQRALVVPTPRAGLSPAARARLELASLD